ncbi:hypothetical protein HGM15179_007091 [Zosterops borbonicus]|uniref:Uncharacterized protein n=1 Tax=Zosterops borbonicus TaxID=364589 RepID=A0A8K1GL03_9PASS|nr:hypothetical protein HGM15179_007091 [Zosterops borbonicus]
MGTGHLADLGAPLGTGPCLELRHTGDNDSGHYHCQVSDGDSVAESVALNVTVLGKRDPQAGGDPNHSILQDTFIPPFLSLLLGASLSLRLQPCLCHHSACGQCYCPRQLIPYVEEDGSKHDDRGAASQLRFASEERREIMEVNKCLCHVARKAELEQRLRWEWLEQVATGTAPGHAGGAGAPGIAQGAQEFSPICG